MKWFKHMSDMRNDMFIRELRYRFKNEGYAIWCMLLEIYAQECGNDPGQYVTFFWEILCQDLGITGKKLARILDFFVEKGKIILDDPQIESKSHADDTQMESKPHANAIQNRSSHDLNRRTLKIKIPKMAQLKDSHTANLQAASKQVDPKKKEEEAEVEVRDPEGEEENLKNKTHTQKNAGVCVGVSGFEKNADGAAASLPNEQVPKFLECATLDERAALEKKLFDGVEDPDLPLVRSAMTHYEKMVFGADAAWVVPYLAPFIKRSRLSDSDPRPPDVLKCWFDAVDAGRSGNPKAINWFKKVFERFLSDWQPPRPCQAVAGSAGQAGRPKKWEPYLSAALVRVAFDEKDIREMPGSELRWSIEGGYFMHRSGTVPFENVQIVEGEKQ